MCVSGWRMSWSWLTLLSPSTPVPFSFFCDPFDCVIAAPAEEYEKPNDAGSLMAADRSKPMPPPITGAKPSTSGLSKDELKQNLAGLVLGQAETLRTGGPQVPLTRAQPHSELVAQEKQAGCGEGRRGEGRRHTRVVFGFALCAVSVYFWFWFWFWLSLCFDSL